MQNAYAVNKKVVFPSIFCLGPRAMAKKSTQPETLRLPPDLQETLAAAVEKLDLARADVIRLAIRIGMRQMAARNYDTAGLYISRDAQDPSPAIPVAAETPAP
jgi:hypothetical protein